MFNDTPARNILDTLKSNKISLHVLSYIKFITFEIMYLNISFAAFKIAKRSYDGIFPFTIFCSS